MGVYEDDPNQKIEELREKRKARDASDLAKVLAMREGRRLVWRILSMAGVFALSYSGEAQWETNFNEGRRSVGNLLLKDIPPEVELVMKNEARSDKLLQTQEQEEIIHG